jgi:hypothetical protein
LQKLVFFMNFLNLKDHKLTLKYTIKIIKPVLLSKQTDFEILYSYKHSDLGFPSFIHYWWWYICQIWSCSIQILSIKNRLFHSINLRQKFIQYLNVGRRVANSIKKYIVISTSLLFIFSVFSWILGGINPDYQIAIIYKK